MGRKRKKINRIQGLRDLNFEGPNLELSGETKRWIFIILLFVSGILAILSLMNSAGTLGVYFNLLLKSLFGVTRWILPILLISVGYFLVRPVVYGFRFINIVGLIIFILGLNGFIHLVLHQEDLVGAAKQGLGGGYFGVILSFSLFKLMGFWAAIVVMLALVVIGFILLFERLIVNTLEKKQVEKETEETDQNNEEQVGLVAKLSGFFSNLWTKRGEAGDEGSQVDDVGYEEADELYEADPEFSHQSIDVEQHGGQEEGNYMKDEKPPADIEESEDYKSDKEFSVAASKFKRVKVDLPIGLLDGKTTAPKGGDLKANKLIIQKTLRNFGIEAEMSDASVGPTVTQYTLKPAEGVRLSKITGLSDNLALALAAHPIRIEAPIPNRSLVGIEVPNEAKSAVPLGGILSSLEFQVRESNLSIALGKDVMGKPWLYPLDKMPHILIAGATGSGKSVCINTLILSLLFQNGPGELKFIMVDPKRVELPLYNGIPHLLTPVITDVKKTINALRWTIKEMENRFDVLSKNGHRNISSYNEKTEDKMSYIVFVIDELADIMATAGPEVEGAIVRLAQMSRAVGIHLVLATQRPSVDVITGLIKANIPTRVAFSVASLVDSRTILDMSGAEKLLGRGDMLFMSSDIPKPKRLQGAFSSDVEIKRVIDHLKKQADPDYLDEVTERQSSPTGMIASGGIEEDGGDPLLLEAKDVIIKSKKASASLLQRRLRIGYSRAARILDLLEAQGVIGPADGAKPRDVLITFSTDDTIINTQNSEEDINDDDEISTKANSYKEGDDEDQLS